MRRFAILLPAAILFAVGCNGSDNGAVVPHPVSGKVIYDGKPVAGVEVTLLPNDAPMVPKIPRNPRGITGADGRFTITTFAEGDGAAEGGYQVLLAWPLAQGEVPEAEEVAETDRLMGWYDGTHSNFAVRVKAGQNDIPTFNLPKVTRPPPISEGVPGRN